MKLRLPVALVGLLISPGALPTGSQPTFRSGVEGIRVDALVTADGRVIADLTSADFEVRDNGVVQNVTVISRAGLASPVRVILTFDTSSSMQGERLGHVRAAARALVGSLQVDDEAGLIVFDRAVVERVPVSREFERIDQALAHATASGDTALVDATIASLLAAEDDASRSVAIVFSDGADTASFMAPKLALDAARAGNSVLYGVWSGRGPRPAFLREVAEASGGRLIELRGTADMTEVLLAIVREFRQRYLITYTPTGVPPTGWHRVDVRVKLRGASVHAREGYFGRPQ